MKILVPVKRVIDPYVKVRVKPDNTGVETQNVKMAINPFDEIALEEAIRLKEKGLASEIIAVSVGTQSSQETLRYALALGATSAILLQTDLTLEPLTIANLLKIITENNAIQLILMGKQAIDDDSNQTGQMLASLLGWPQATFVSALAVSGDHIQVERELDSGLQTLDLQLPAVITTDLRLNTPRFAKLPDIMKAKTKPMEIIAANSLGVDFTPQQTLLSVEAPPSRKAGIRVENVDALLDKLRNEAKVIE